MNYDTNDIELLSIFGQLSPSNQRLVRELVFKLAQLEQVATPEAHDSRLDYSAYVDAWLSHLVNRGLSPRTIIRYRRTISHLFIRHPHPTRADLEEFLSYQLHRGLKPLSVLSDYNPIFSFFKYLFDFDVTKTNPASKLNPPKVSKTIREAPPAADVMAIMNIKKSLRRQVMLLLLITCGFRVSELASIRISNIVDRSVKVLGKGNKERIVPLLDSVYDQVMKLVEELRARGNNGDWLFPGQKSGTHIITESIDVFFRLLSSKAGVKRITPHHLRHFAATAMLSQGASLKATSQILGHKSTSTTADVYWHVIDRQEIIDQQKKFSPLNAFKL